MYQENQHERLFIYRIESKKMFCNVSSFVLSFLNYCLCHCLNDALVLSLTKIITYLHPEKCTDDDFHEERFFVVQVILKNHFNLKSCISFFFSDMSNVDK